MKGTTRTSHACQLRAVADFGRNRCGIRRRPVRSVIVALILVWASSSPAQAAITFFVSPTGHDGNSGTEIAPFLTIERARDAVRDVNQSMREDVVVYLRGGRYELANTLIFDERDGGADGHYVIYRAYSGETPILSGGRILTGWTPVADGLFQTNVGPLRFRQLYVDGRRAVRARQPNASQFNRLLWWDESDRAVVVKSEHVGIWHGLSHVEMVILKEWTQNNLRIHSIAVSGREGQIVPLEPDRSKAFGGHQFLRQDHQSYYFENAPEFLDEEGEWYLNPINGDLFYKPRAGEDMTSAVVVAPRLERLVQIEGTLDNPIQRLHLISLVFEHSTWTNPDREGYATGQADLEQSNLHEMEENSSRNRIPAAIHIQNAHHVRMERTVVRHTGGAAVALYAGTSHTEIIGNLITDIGAGGIAADLSLQSNPSDQRKLCTDDVIANNYIAQIGRDYHSSVGIFAGYTQGIRIEHNELTDHPYTGISVGWGWRETDTALRNNTIRANRIHHVVNLVADGAGVYTLSKQPGTIVAENYIHDIARSPWAGSHLIAALYLDEGSSAITVKNNVLENIPMGLDLHRAHYNTIVNLTGGYEELGYSSNNEFLSDDEFPVSAIKAQSGLEEAYRDVPTLGGRE